MQTSAKGTYSGMLDCAGGILRNEGPLAFYKAGSQTGTLTPLLGIGACVSIQFGVLEYTKRYFTAQNIRSGIGAEQSAALSTPQLVVAGALAGLGNGFVSGPVEHIRIRLQTQSNTNPVYRGPFDAIKKIASKYGIRGIYKGQNVTFLREATGYGVYFWTYEKLVQREMAQKGIRREQISPGYALWAVIYPIDMVKSRMQTDGFSPSDGQKYRSTLHCVRTVWKTEGISAFTRGLGPTLIRCGLHDLAPFLMVADVLYHRSPFANGATFLGFEMANRLLNSF
ncbi:mitochondrial carrier [Lactarius indigo]|nr:mitochondrial carrier [Lactarius indigo]